MDVIYDKYIDPKNPGSFSGVSGFIKNNKFKAGLVSKVLQSLPTYTLHKPIKYKFQRSKTLVEGIDDQWQIDLIDVSNIKGSNSQYKFILTCIDVFSKKGWAVPILNKNALSVLIAFKTILKDGRKPNLIYCDDGKEFKGEFKKYLLENDIRIFVSTTKNKASVVERFNRTLKEKMYRYFTFQKDLTINLYNKRYLEVLPKLIESYNNSYHRSIKTAPNKVNKENEDQIHFNLYGFYKKDGDNTFVKVKYKPGTYVRIAQNKTLFEKGYTASWSKDIFIIDKVIAQVPVLYKLKELSGKYIKDLPELYYSEELQKVELPFDTYEVVKDLKNNKILVNRLNDNEAEPIIVDRNEFLQDQYVEPS